MFALDRFKLEALGGPEKLLVDAGAVVAAAAGEALGFAAGEPAAAGEAAGAVVGLAAGAVVGAAAGAVVGAGDDACWHAAMTETAAETSPKRRTERRDIGCADHPVRLDSSKTSPILAPPLAMVRSR